MKRRAAALALLLVAASGCATSPQPAAAVPSAQELELSGILLSIGPHPHAVIMLQTDTELGPKSWELQGVRQEFAKDYSRRRVVVRGAVIRAAGQFRPPALKVESVDLLAP